MIKVYALVLFLTASTSFNAMAQTAFAARPKYSLGSDETANPTNNQSITTTRAKTLLPELLKAVFNTRWKDESVLLTVDAAWSGDSLMIFYNYYRGTNVLSLEDDQLIEKIIFTVHPQQIDALDTEDDEFLFLYLRNADKSKEIHSRLHRPAAGETENNWVSSLGIPVKRDSLPEIIQSLKALRTPSKS
jgi:hypothetical protein